MRLQAPACLRAGVSVSTVPAAPPLDSKPLLIQRIRMRRRERWAARSAGMTRWLGNRDLRELMIAECRMQGVVNAIPPAGEVEALNVCPVDLHVGTWWVVHTKSRQEKALLADLGKLNIGCYLPLVSVKRRYGGRTFRLQLPLFPSYLFMCGNEDHRYATLMTHRAAAVIRVADQERLKYELRQIFRVTTGEDPVDLYPGLRRGRRCRVVSGSLAGLEGIVLRRRGACRVYVGVQALGQSAELEIDPSLLEVIE